MTFREQVHGSASRGFAAQDPGEQLVIVAPARTLGELRKHMDRSVAQRVTAAIAKDPVKQPIREIEQLLAGHSEPA